MSATTVKRDTPQRYGTTKSLPMAAAVSVLQGTIAAMDSAGRGCVATADNTKRIVGKWKSSYDNSAGIAAAITGQYEEGCFRWANGDAITIASRGLICFCQDNQTVYLSSNSGARPVAGRIVDVDSDGVWVEMSLMAEGTASVDLTSEVTGTLPVANGGSGAATFTDHGVLLGSGTGAFTATAVGATGTVLHGNTGADPSFGAVDVASEVTGVLPVANGGSGAASLTDHGVLVGSGTGAVTALAVMGAGTFLRGAAGADPAASTSTLADTYVAGDLLHASGANAVTGLADVAVGSVLASGGVGAAPAYSATPSVTTITGSTSVLTPDLDAAAATTLQVGPATATKVEIADTGVTTEIQGPLTALEGATVTGNLSVSGNLRVTGDTISTSSEELRIADNFVDLNDGYTTAAAQTGGIVVNYLPTATVDTVAAGGFTAASVGVSDALIATAGAATFALNDLVMVSGATLDGNNGLYEVHAHAANVLTLKGVGLNACVQPFTQNQVTTSAGATGAITKVNVSVMRAGADGLWESGAGSTNAFTYGDLYRVGGADVAVADGGTGTSTAAVTAGQLLRGSGAGTWGISTATYPDAPAAIGDIVVATGAAAYGHITAGAAGTVLRGAGAGVVSAFGALDLTTDVGASILPVANGGTGVASPTDHCVVVGSGAAAMTVLAAGATGQVLKGVTGADPTFAAVDLTADVAATILPVANGGTGVVSPTDHAILVGSGAAAMTEIGPLTNGQLVIGSTGADPVAAALTNGTVTATGGAGTITLNVTGDSLDGDEVANVADDNLVGGIPVIHKFMVSGGVTGNNDFVIQDKTEILDVHFIKTNAAGGGGGSVQLIVGGNAITDDVSVNVADKTRVAVGTIDDAFNVIAAGATLRFTHTNGAAFDTTCIAVVTGIKRA